MPAPDVAALLALLDPAIADEARTAVEWLTGGEPLETVTQLDVCEFLWFTLPLKVDGDPVRLARALGQLLSLGGLSRYAEICTSAVTLRIFRVYAEDGEDAGNAAYQEALAATGVLPPDVPELAWSMIMGPEELGAHVACSAALELAQLSDTPFDAVELTRDWLTRPRAELGGDSWLHRVHGERLNRWVLGRGEARRELAQPFEVRLHAPVPLDPSLEPVARGLICGEPDEVTLLLLADGSSWSAETLQERVGAVAGRTSSDLLSRLASLGLLADPVRLTPTGQLVALSALRSHALRPRKYVTPG
ncbi:hypothetical protein ACIBH1_40495 [Nonomuraea sp. NPDC050663]|uniref:hypothetical protein n=1 Tax=Nonomuraea sp. NPDC050663 TaxID=3364370 RepID=UPI001795642D|nr:hypothetical protein [Thermoactinospora sp.]